MFILTLIITNILLQNVKYCQLVFDHMFSSCHTYVYNYVKQRIIPFHYTCVALGTVTKQLQCILLFPPEPTLANTAVNVHRILKNLSQTNVSGASISLLAVIVRLSKYRWKQTSASY